MKYQKGNYTVNRQSKEDGQLMKNYKNIVTNIDKNRNKNRRVQSAFLLPQQIKHIYRPCRIGNSKKRQRGHQLAGTSTPPCYHGCRMSRGCIPFLQTLKP